MVHARVGEGACETASVLTLESGPARLVVAPEIGGRIVALGIAGLDHLATPDVDDHNFACFPMAPWAGSPRRLLSADGHEPFRGSRAAGSWQGDPK
jgi:hypothetical protein